MDYQIVTASTTGQLTTKVKDLIKEGWKPVGGHQALVTHKQNRYSGDQHKDTVYDLEYSQTLIKE